jgi:23S rRNA (uracil1939-C5)-methyltransferase
METKEKIAQDFQLDIESLSFGGMGIGHLNGLVVFIPHTAPGEKVMTRVVTRESDYLVGALQKIIHPSPMRIEAKCPYFGECGGCQWQHLDYDEQLRQKEWLVKEAFTRIGHLDTDTIRPCLPSPSPFHYRHRMQFNINHKNKTPHIGLYRRKTHSLVDICECPIAHPLINKVLKTGWDWLSKTDDKHLHGMDITIDIKGEKAILVLRYIKGSIEEKKKDFALLQELCPEITGALIRIETYRKASYDTAGDPTLDLVYDDAQYKIGPETFIQVNLNGNEMLIRKVLDAIPEKTERILELHCGMGNFSIPMSRTCQTLFGIESNPEPYRYALINAHNNRRPNCHFIKKSDIRGLKQMINSGLNFSFLVMDPPRSGCKDILSLIPNLKIPKIIYVSCNPSTLARDLSILVKDQNYHIEYVQPIDMFPQTYHVECVTVLSKVF